MKHGDLANSVSYTVAFRCEDCLVQYKENGVVNKILNAVVGKAYRAEINPQYKEVMEYIYRHTECTVDLVVENKNYTEDMKHILEDIPYSRIILIDRESQISSRLLVGDITLYVDENPDRRSLVNSSYAIPIRRIREFIR